jgi:hypothetical protein
MLLERWQAGKGLPELEDAGFFARRRIGQALSRSAKGEPLGLEGDDEALYRRYVEAVQVPDARLAALARARAETARDALVAKGVAEGRITVVDPAPPADPGVVIGFRVAG